MVEVKSAALRTPAHTVNFHHIFGTAQLADDKNDKNRKIKTRFKMF
jgi:hypothetical protein